MKALGVGLGAFAFHDVEVVRLDVGRAGAAGHRRGRGAGRGAGRDRAGTSRSATRWPRAAARRASAPLMSPSTALHSLGAMPVD